MAELLVKLQFPTTFPRVIRRFICFLVVYGLTHISSFYKLILVFVHMHLSIHPKASEQMHVNEYED